MTKTRQYLTLNIPSIEIISIISFFIFMIVPTNSEAKILKLQEYQIADTAVIYPVLNKCMAMADSVNPNHGNYYELEIYHKYNALLISIAEIWEDLGVNCSKIDGFLQYRENTYFISFGDSVKYEKSFVKEKNTKTFNLLQRTYHGTDGTSINWVFDWYRDKFRLFYFHDGNW